MRHSSDPEPQGTTSRHILSLTSIRGIAAIWVVIYHYTKKIDSELFCITCHTRILSHGYLAVDLFFILSGYVLTITYATRLMQSHLYPRDYWVARFARVYPLHFFTLIAYASIFLLYNWIDTGNTLSLDISGNNMSSFISNMMLVQALFPPSWNYPSWSVSIEFGLYILFPFAAYFSLRYRKRYSLLLLLVCVISAHPETLMS